MNRSVLLFLIIPCGISFLIPQNGKAQLSFKQSEEAIAKDAANNTKPSGFNDRTDLTTNNEKLLSSNAALFNEPVGEKQQLTIPGDTPEIFLPGLVSVDGKNSHALNFSPDGKTLIFSRYPDRKSYISTKIDDQWSVPVEAFFLGKEVSFSNDGNKIFYYNEGEIYFVGKNQTEWSKPQNPGPNINTGEVEYYPSIVKNETLYFSRNSSWDQGRIMRSAYKNGTYQIAIDQGNKINNGGASHAWVARDESYMLFNSPRKGSFTKLDIWVSFKNSDNSWGEPVNLGENINSGADAILCPTVSPDGKYMYYTKLNFSTNTGYIYRVSTKVFMDLKPDK
jgi:hypothetical protein